MGSSPTSPEGRLWSRSRAEERNHDESKSRPESQNLLRPLASVTEDPAAGAQGPALSPWAGAS